MKQKFNLPIEIIGWYGVIAIISGYFLISFAIISARSYEYQLLVLSGSLGIVIHAYYKKDRQPMILNIVFALVALSSLISLVIIK